MKRLIPFLIIALTLIQHATGQDRAARIDSFLTDQYLHQRFFGNVLIADQGKVIYQRSFGNANEETQRPLDENSVFELASVSKQFTAMGIVMLKEMGKLDYDDPLGKYIPELSFYEGVTIKTMLIHTSGLPDYMEVMDSTFDKSKIAVNDDIISIFAKVQPAVHFEPNTQWEYSNTAYALLASVIERVSGISYGDFLNKMIFVPLQMNHTLVYRRRYAPQTVEDYALGYVYSDSLKKFVLPDALPELNVVIWLDGIVGDGTVNSTTGDLFKWDRALNTDQLVSKKSMEEIFSSYEMSDHSPTEYGFGWMIEDNGVYGKIEMHTGGWPGYTTLIDRHSDNDKTIIVLMNHESDSAYLPLGQLRKLVYNIPPVQFIHPDKSEQKMIAGEYKNEAGKINKIELKGGILYREMSDGNKYELRPISAFKYQMMNVSPDVFYEFVVSDNKVVKYIITQPETKVVKEAEKVH